MANRTIAVIKDGKLAPLPAGDIPTDAAGNPLSIPSAMIIKGVIDCSTNPNYPTGDSGESYIITVAGKIGGVSGITVEIGDMIVCTVDSSATGTQSEVGANWIIVNKNVIDTEAASRRSETYCTAVYLDGVNSLTDALVMDLMLPFDCYIIATSVKMLSARTGGTFTLELHKNGTQLVETTLNLEINDINTTKHGASQNYGVAGLSCVAGDTIGFLATTSTFTPLSNVAFVTITVERY